MIPFQPVNLSYFEDFLIICLLAIARLRQTLDAIRAACSANSAVIESKIGQTVVCLPVGRRLEIIVELVVYFCLVKGEFVRVVDVDELFS